MPSVVKLILIWFLRPMKEFYGFDCDNLALDSKYI
jgi:hypothetical protein